MQFSLSAKNALTKITGTWKLNFPNMHFKFVVSHGKISIKGHPIKLLVSTNKKFPSSAGWFMFKYLTWVYYVRFTGHGIKVVGLHGKKFVSAKTVVVSGGMIPGRMTFN